MGAKVTFRFEDGSTHFVAGAFPDVHHIAYVKESVQKKAGKKVVGHSAVWTDLFEFEKILFNEVRPIIL